MNLFLTEGGVLKLGYYGLTTQRELYYNKESDWIGVLGMALIEMMGIIPYAEWDDTIHKENGSAKLPFNSLTIKSDELLSFLLGCFQWVNERRSVKELMDVSVLRWRMMSRNHL